MFEITTNFPQLRLSTIAHKKIMSYNDVSESDSLFKDWLEILDGDEAPCNAAMENIRYAHALKDCTTSIIVFVPYISLFYFLC